MVLIDSLLSKKLDLSISKHGFDNLYLFRDYDYYLGFTFSYYESPYRNPYGVLSYCLCELTQVLIRIWISIWGFAVGLIS